MIPEAPGHGVAPRIRRCRREGADLLRYRLVPVVYTTGAVLSALMAVIGLVAPVDLGPRLALFLTFGGLSYLVGRLAWRRRGLLEVGGTLRYRRGMQRFDLPRRAAVAVFVERTDRPLREPTDYLLVVRIGGREHRLPFAEHWLSGKRAQQQAERLAAELGVPIEDPVGAIRRRSRIFLVRWLGEGQEWRVLLLTVALTLALGLVVGVGLGR